MPLDASRIALIIPTLNEARNIVALIEAFRVLPFEFYVIVADSNSPDGTAQIVRSHFSTTPTVQVLNCAARGRGASVVHAYRWIMQQSLPIDAVAVADADFSHKPGDFLALHTALAHADVVIGSRYVSGSRIKDWPLTRRTFSATANALIHLLLHTGLRDHTNGYRLFRIAQLYRLDLDRIDADGFIHLSQELIQWLRSGARVVEVPTLFINRQRGKSNLRLTLITESLLVAFRLAWQYRAWPKIRHRPPEIRREDR